MMLDTKDMANHVFKALIADPRKSAEIARLADVEPHVITNFRKGRTLALSFDTIRRLVPVLWPGHSLTITKDETDDR